MLWQTYSNFIVRVFNKGSSCDWRVTCQDNLGYVARDLSSEDSPLVAIVFWVFVFLSALTVINMLIGVLCQVVISVAKMEREAMLVSFVMLKMKDILTIDANNDNKISKAHNPNIASQSCQHPSRCLQHLPSGTLTDLLAFEKVQPFSRSELNADTCHEDFHIRTVSLKIDQQCRNQMMRSTRRNERSFLQSHRELLVSAHHVCGCRLELATRRHDFGSR